MTNAQAKRDSGFVSIIVALLLIVVLALITAGFTRIMLREQRQAIDRQLSWQALYAAESGVNDVIQAINNRLPGYTDPNKTNCDPSGLPNGGDLSGDGTIAYTCALYNISPGTLDYDVSTTGSKIVDLKTASGNDFNTISISWGNENEPSNNTASPPLPSCSAALGTIATHPASRGGEIPLLRVDLTSVAGGGPYQRDSLLQNTDYMYLVPCAGPGVTTHDFAVGTAARGSIVPVECSGVSPQPCTVDISNLSPASDRFFARMRPVYDNASVSIRATENAGGSTPGVAFDGAQIGIDVTAKAGDVVRRLRVSVPFSASVDVPEYALQAFDGVCKQLDVRNDDPTFGPLDIVDFCSGPPPGPICPSTTPSTLKFNLSQIAIVESGGDEFQAAHRIDVSSDPNPPATADPDRWTEWEYTVPDLDLGASAPGLPFRVNTGCDYTVEYTVFCGSPTASANAGNVWGTPPLQECFVNQLNEGFRASFYSGREAGDPDQCDRSTRLAYFDVPDHFIDVAPSDFTATVDVTEVGSGTIICMEMRASCETSFAHIGCNDPLSPIASSILMHEINWIESP